MPAADAVWRDGRVHVGGRSLSPADVVRGWYGRPAGEVIGRGYVRNLGADPAFWEIGMGGVEIDVDRETGVIRLLSYTGLADVGRAINPQLCEQQDVGAVVMGLGHTLFEEMTYSDSGSLLSASMIASKSSTPSPNGACVLVSSWWSVLSESMRCTVPIRSPMRFTKSTTLASFSGGASCRAA